MFRVKFIVWLHPFIKKGCAEMSEGIQIALISAGLAALVNCIFQLINRLLDNRNAKEERNNKKIDDFIEKKEAVYIAAIDRLLQIRRGFDYTREMIMHDKVLQEAIDKSNDAYVEIAPKLRLYSTDKIFNQFMNLSRFAQFSYARENGPRLFENSKVAFEANVVILSRLMQEDLGIRKMNTGHDTIICPECAKEHDIISKCPKCGMTFEQYQNKMHEVLEQSFETDLDEN